MYSSYVQQARYRDEEPQEIEYQGFLTLHEQLISRLHRLHAAQLHDKRWQGDSNCS